MFFFIELEWLTCVALFDAEIVNEGQKNLQKEWQKMH